MNAPVKPDYLKAKDAANYLGIVVGTLYNLKNQGKLKGYKRGKMLYFKQFELDEIIESGKFEQSKTL